MQNATHGCLQGATDYHDIVHVGRHCTYQPEPTLPVPDQAGCTRSLEMHPILLDIVNITVS